MFEAAHQAQHPQPWPRRISALHQLKEELTTEIPTQIVKNIHWLSKASWPPKGPRRVTKGLPRTIENVSKVSIQFLKVFIMHTRLRYESKLRGNLLRGFAIYVRGYLSGHIRMRSKGSTPLFPKIKSDGVSQGWWAKLGHGLAHQPTYPTDNTNVEHANV